MSRHQAKRSYRGESLKKDMEARGIYVRNRHLGRAAEEAGAAYKDIDAVVEATELAGLSKKVARMTPIGNIKG